MRKYLVFILASVALTGCAHQAMRGTVAMKISDREGHVCLGTNEVRAGDKVALFKNECRNDNARAANCTMTRYGEGEITSVLNEHYSIMTVQPGTVFEEGTLVEKR